MATNAFSNTFEQVFEQGVSTVKQQVTQQAKQTTQAVASNLGIKSGDPTAHTATDAAAQLQDQFNETSGNAGAQDDPAKQALATKQLEAKDEQERQIKLADARKRLNQLHNQVYYDPTFNHRRREETVQEKIEQEDQLAQQKKMMELEEKKKKDEPIALARAKRTAEMNRGVSG